MSTLRARVWSCLALLAALLLPSALWAQVPELTLEGLDGQRHALSEFIGRGRWVALNIWGPRCPPCVEEMPGLQMFHERRQARDALVLGVAIDFPSYGYAKRDEVRRFLDDYFIDFPVLLADGRQAARINGGPLRGTPTTLLFRPDGSLAVRHLGMISEQKLNEYMARP